MTRTPFSRRRFLQLSGGLALAGVSLPLWAHDMADMAGGDAHPALRLPEPYKIKLAINKARYASRRSPSPSSRRYSVNTTSTLSLLTSAAPPMCCWRRSPPVRPTPGWGWRCAG